jgi:hypothetical protein
MLVPFPILAHNWRSEGSCRLYKASVDIGFQFGEFPFEIRNFPMMCKSIRLR